MLRPGRGRLLFVRDNADSRSRRSLLQFNQGFLESAERDRNADPRFLRLEDDENGGLAVFELLDQRILHHHLRVSCERMAAHKRRVPNILVIDLQTEARRQQNAQRCKHAQNPRAVGKLLEVDG